MLSIHFQDRAWDLVLQCFAFKTISFFSNEQENCFQKFFSIKFEMFEENDAKSENNWLAIYIMRIDFFHLQVRYDPRWFNLEQNCKIVSLQDWIV